MKTYERLYRDAGMALLRAARTPVSSAPDRWPNLSDDTDIEGWRRWLVDVWSRKQTAEAITLASPSLARRVEEILSGARAKPREVHRAVVSVVRYLLRETGRPTPFGLFAGVAPVTFGPTTRARWGRRHRPLATADGQWLADVIAGLEACPELLERLPVMVNSLRVVRGGRLVLPGAARVEARHTLAVQAAERIAVGPVRFGALAGALGDEFPTVQPASIRAMLTELVAQRFLITCLRAPATVTDPLAHLVDQLHQVRAHEVARVAPTVAELRALDLDLDRQNQAEAFDGDHVSVSAIRRMRRLSRAGRSPVAVDLRLDCDLELPEQVAREMEAAASILLRLSTQPGGIQAWRDYYVAFVERYGTGTLVPLSDVVDPDIGLGYPASYPGSLLDPPASPASSARDDLLLALVQHAAVNGVEEIMLDEATIRDLTVGDLEQARIPPHVELTARIHAESPAALDRGEFTLTVTPARAAGTMTGRFTGNGSTGLADMFQRLPTSDADAIAAQLTVPPLYPQAENISRTPRFLDHIISLGEHRAPDEGGAIALEDLAITADRYRLRLVWVSQNRRPVEPQMFHALRLDKQPPTLARFLANLPRSHTATYTEFDWGAAATLPYLPRLRYRRSVLSPARWRISATDLPGRRSGWTAWRDALTRWQHRWRLPDTVELRDGDRTLRLDLTQPAHATLLRLHLDRAEHAVLTEAADPSGYGWLGYAHQVAITLLSTQPPTPSPQYTGPTLVHIRNDRYGQLPAAPESQWLFAKIYVHPERQPEVIAEHLPRLLTDLGDGRQWWFLRYRSAHDPHHLRLRFRIRDPADYGACAATLGAWAADLRRLRISPRLVLDTYYPELGRYGDSPTMAAAEAVFATDSHVVLTQLRHIPDAVVQPVALAVANMVDIARGFTGGTETGMAWLTRDLSDNHPAPASRMVRDQAMALAYPGSRLAAVRELPGGQALAEALARRRTALDTYQQRLPSAADRDAVLSSLLHMHHIRAVGIDRDSERVCRRLARVTALAWQTRNGRRSPR